MDKTKRIILGIDEVGRGPWAGPMVVGACVLGNEEIGGLNDSKKLSAKKREKLAYEIKEKAVAVATGWVTSGEIDNLGLSEALKLAARRAVSKIDCDFDEIVIDGTIKLIDDARVTTLPKADSLIKAVSAASIVAKVARDLYMTKLAVKYPEYGFEKHMGYGTSFHKETLGKYGACPEHRRSFRPVAEALGAPKEKEKKILKTTGRIAENKAVEYLVDLGHEILAQNWKTKICEIDIVSAKDNMLYFTEVKYRKGKRGGGGIDAISKEKERQMRFAAKVYMEFNELDGKLPAVLSAIALTGEPIFVEEYIEDIDAMTLMV
jgi:Ribonuclease HII